MWPQRLEWYGHRPRNPGSQQKLEEARDEFSSRACWHLDDSPLKLKLASSTVREWMCVGLATSFMAICYSSPRKLYTHEGSFPAVWCPWLFSNPLTLRLNQQHLHPSLLKVELCPPKNIFWTPNLSVPVNVTLFGNSLDRCNQGKMRSFFEGEGDLSHYDWCSYKKRPETYRELCDDGSRDWSDVSTGQGVPRIARNTRS